MSKEMKYFVRYDDNTGNGVYIMEFDSEEDAERAIEEDLQNCKDYCQSLEYDYGDFGSKTEFWVVGGDEYASWERLWK